MAFAMINPVALSWKNQGIDFILGVPKRVQPRCQEATPAQAEASQPRPAEMQKGSPAYIAVQENGVQARQRWQPMPVEQWPRHWAELFLNVKKGLIAWTYSGLGNDLAKDIPADPDELKSRKARGNLFRKIFKDLAFQSGTHTFWPAALAGQKPDPQLDREIFWSAVSRLGCRGVVIMGSEAARPLVEGSALRPLMMLRQKGQFIWILREPDSLADSEEFYKRTLVFLKDSFRKFFLH